MRVQDDVGQCPYHTEEVGDAHGTVLSVGLQEGPGPRTQAPFFVQRSGDLESQTPGSGTGRLGWTRCHIMSHSQKQHSWSLPLGLFCVDIS